MVAENLFRVWKPFFNKYVQNIKNSTHGFDGKSNKRLDTGAKLLDAYIDHQKDQLSVAKVIGSEQSSRMAKNHAQHRIASKKLKADPSIRKL